MSALKQFALQTPEPISVWGLREEARKSWNHHLCNELVYVSQSCSGDFKVSHVIAKKYLRSDAWFEIRWTQADPGEARENRYYAIVEVVNLALHPAVKSNVDFAAVDGDSFVFVDVPKPVELPEGMTTKGVRSVLWLKKVQSFADVGMEQSSLADVSCVRFANGEDNLSLSSVGGGDCFRVEMDEVPGQLVKRGTKAIDEIPGDKRNVHVRSARLDYEAMKRSLRIIFFGDRVRVAVDPPLNLRLKSFEVMLRPTGFGVNMFE